MNEGKVTTSLADVVYEQVEQDILTGVYKRGDVLTELKLSQRLQVSRTPVREALRRLEQDDLVECQGKSIVVMGVTHQDLLDLLEIRLRLEGMVTARCCQRITSEELTALDEIITLQDFYVSRSLPEKIQESDGLFHRTIYAACGSRMLEKQLTNIHKRLVRYRKLSVSNRARLSNPRRSIRKFSEPWPVTTQPCPRPWLSAMWSGPETISSTQRPHNSRNKQESWLPVKYRKSALLFYRQVGLKNLRSPYFSAALPLCPK